MSSSLSPEQLREHLYLLIEHDLLGSKGERPKVVPSKVCTAVLTLCQYLVEDWEGELLEDLERAIIGVNNTLGQIVWEQDPPLLPPDHPARQ